jgi:hypothetical protein
MALTRLDHSRPAMSTECLLRSLPIFASRRSGQNVGTATVGPPAAVESAFMETAKHGVVLTGPACFTLGTAAGMVHVPPWLNVMLSPLRNLY